MKFGFLAFATALAFAIPASAEVKFALTSPVFEAGAKIPVKYTCLGENVSPKMRWNTPPSGTRSLSLVAVDPDAPPGTWVHWVVYGIPSDHRGLEEALPPVKELAGGIRQGKANGVTDFPTRGYSGPCPPAGDPHRYFFRLKALDVIPALSDRAGKPELERASEGHVLGEAVLMGTFGR